MDTVDIVSWVLVGLIAGGLAGALQPAMPMRGWLVVLGVGLVGSLAGGWLTEALSGTSAVDFLGAVCAAVLAAVPTGYLLQRRIVTRYHT